MKVGFVDVDGHNFPNIPLMKLSAWHKAQGDSAEWYQPLWGGYYDKVYVSKVFSFSPDYPYHIDAGEVIYGGSGYCIELEDGKVPQGKARADRVCQGRYEHQLRREAEAEDTCDGRQDTDLVSKGQSA